MIGRPSLINPETCASLPQRHLRLPISRRAVLAGGLAFCAQRSWGDEADMLAAITDDFGGASFQSGRIEIVMPEFSDSGSSVPMDIFVPSPMTETEHPSVVRVYAPRNPRPRVGALFFSPACGEARISTRVRLGAFQDVVAIVQMSDGDTFRAVRRVNVTYGACEDAVANDQFPPGWTPSIRIALPDEVAAGEIFTVRTIINHPMETGLRRDKSGLLVPVRIVERFSCRVNDEEVFAAELEPAIAANPYVAFSLRLLETADLTFEWIDTTGERYVRTGHVEVV